MADPKLSNRNVPALCMRAALQPASVNEAERSVDITWSTGQKVLRRSFWDGDFNEELSMDPAHVRMGRLQSGRAPFLINHDAGDVRNAVGLITSARIENGVGTATVRFLKDDPTADAVWNRVRQGIAPNVSVGYRTYKFEQVEGGDGAVPTFRATDWEPHEVSLVAIGADSTAHVRGADLTQNSCEFITRGAAPQERQHMEPKNETPAPVQTDADRKAELEKVRAEAERQERTRATGIQAIVRKAKLGDDIAAKLVTDGVSLDAARAFVLEQLAERSEATAIQGHARVEVGTDAVEKRTNAMIASMLARSGGEFRRSAELARAKKVKGFEDLDLDGGEYRKFTIMDMARECLELKGVKTRGKSASEIAKLALEQRTGGMATTTDFPVLLENVMYKQLLASYATVDDTWKAFCKTDTVPDFRTSNRYRTGSFGVLDAKGEHGEFKSKAIPDGAKYTISTQSWGNIVRVTREALINDDMGAIADTLGKYGRAAALSIESRVYAQLTANSGLGPTMADSLPLFDASRSNIGTGAALSVAALDADRVTLAQQKDISNNEYLSFKPDVLLVPIGLGGQARVINEAQFDVDVSNKFQVPNKVRGLFRQIIDTPRLSGTRRYLFTPNSEALVVVFLEGQEGPYMEMRQGFEVDGVEWKLRLDFDVLGFDGKMALTNAGV